MRIAVVTRYFKESPEVLRRCLAWVRSHCVPVDHVLVADGHPQSWVEQQPRVTQIELRKGSADFGDSRAPSASWWRCVASTTSFSYDRVFFAPMTRAGLRNIVANLVKTVGYTCWWDDIYKIAGEEPPPSCKQVQPYRAAAREWWGTLDAHSKSVIEARLGLPIVLPPASSVANE